MVHRSNTFAVLLAVLFCLAACSRTRTMLLIKGSDTEVNLVSDFAESFRQVNPAARIAVTGGGSGTGIAALINRTADIANASRPMKADERALAHKNGIDPRPLVIATDGLAIAVHPDNPLGQISLPQLAAVFRGEIRNWRELGGPDREITCYGRQSNSGTFEFFKSVVLAGGDFGPGVLQMNGNAQIIASLQQDRGGVGYVGAGYISGSGRAVKALAVARDDHQPAILPLESHITNAEYPLTRPLYQYISGQPAGLAREFLEFCLSPAAAGIVRKNGFFPLQPEHRRLNRTSLLSGERSQP